MRYQLLLYLWVLPVVASCQPGTELGLRPEETAVSHTISTPLAATAVAEPTGTTPSDDSLNTEPNTPTPAPTTVSTSAPQSTATERDSLESGRTAEGAYYLGSPGAPIRMIDYSDFM